MTESNNNLIKQLRISNRFHMDGSHLFLAYLHLTLNLKSDELGMKVEAGSML